jgi:hypothetical protein
LKNKSPYYFLYFFATLFLVGCTGGCGNNKSIPSLRETYSPADKNPFGGYVANKLIEQLFPLNNLRQKKESFTKTWDDIRYYDSSSLYICIAPKLFVNEDEVDAMLEYVDAGNDLFIAANEIDEELLHKMSITQKSNEFAFLLGLDSFKTTQTFPHYKDSLAYSYYYRSFDNSFTKFDSTYTKVLGRNENGDPNYLVYFHGNGKLFLHCDARAFSNYFLLKNKNDKYLEKVFAFTANRPEHFYWDDYYRKLLSKRSDEDFSSLSEILKHPPLALAFWLSLLLLGIYILFGGKRIQKIIAPIKPNENTTVTFTETIGRLYLQNKDNKNIADKMIMYFNEHIRNNYYLNTNTINNEFITTLSRKSGIELAKIETLYRTIQHAQQQPQINDFELLSLNTQIQKFYKKI